MPYFDPKRPIRAVISNIILNFAARQRSISAATAAHAPPAQAGGTAHPHKNKPAMNITYHIVYSVCWLVSLLPLWALYRVSDGLYYLLYHLVRYRRPLVRKNLTDSFPDKTEAEIIKIEKEFYSWLCDYFVETLKLFTVSKAEISRRMTFKGVDAVRRAVDNGQSCALYLGHYCNWEWVTSFPLTIGDKAICGQIYHVLENPSFDRLFLRLRERMGAVCIPMAETLRHIARYRHEGKPVIIGFIADQVPFWNNIHYWTDFLNHDTPVLTGTERIVHKAGFAAFYVDMRRTRRGYYSAEFIPLTYSPAELKEFELTEMYFRLLEKTILRQPPYWLWTHNRWKRTREEWEKIIDPVTKKMRFQ